jgi:hypothetical protein
MVFYFKIRKKLHIFYSTTVNTEGIMLQFALFWLGVGGVKNNSTHRTLSIKQFVLSVSIC